MPGEGNWRTIDEVRTEALVCRRCNLCLTRKNVVFGDGPTPARLMIVGEGPGTDEDARGKPFVGRAGEFLDEVLAKAGIDRWEVWITNTVRCRPVDLAGDRLRNRAPEAHEIKACEVWMAQEFRFTAPQAVICLGATSAHALISRDFLIGEGRGKWYSGRDGIPTTATYHPAYALRFDKLRRAEIESQMVNDFRAAIQLIQGG